MLLLVLIVEVKTIKASVIQIVIIGEVLLNHLLETHLKLVVSDILFKVRW